MASRIMSDAEIRRRKKLQGRISQTTGTLGLTSLAAYGTSKIPGAKFMAKTPKLRRIASSIDTKKAKDIALGTSTAGAGIGGAGSYNFAAYTNAESRKRKPAMSTVKKSHEVPFVGEEGTAATYEAELVEFEKAKFSNKSRRATQDIIEQLLEAPHPEKKRKKRKVRKSYAPSAFGVDHG